MHDRRNDRPDRGRSRHDHDGGHGRHGGDRRRGERRGGPDTRFLQLEMSEVLYSDAESITKQAFRELLLEEAKARFRERFGDQITGLAQLAVDELMQDILASLQVEAHIQHRNRDRSSRRERLAGILNAGGGDDRERHEEGDPEPNDEDEGDPGPDEER